MSWKIREKDATFVSVSVSFFPGASDREGSMLGCLCRGNERLIYEGKCHSLLGSLLYLMSRAVLDKAT